MFASEIRKWLLTFEVTIVAFDFVYSLLNIIATHFHQTYWNNLNTLYVNTAVFISRFYKYMVTITYTFPKPIRMQLWIFQFECYQKQVWSIKHSFNTSLYLIDDETKNEIYISDF